MNQTSGTTSHTLPLPTAVLDTLASRVRGNGVFLMLLHPDGSIAWSDRVANPFFSRFAMPLIQYPDPGTVVTRDAMIRLIPNDELFARELRSGVSVAAFAYGERRKTAGIFVLVARGPSFGRGEDILRSCSRLGIDFTWLEQQAASLNPFLPEFVKTQADFLRAAVRDQVRVNELEGELDSLSGQLANTYEELSLIYQLSGGMRVNRRPTEFFKQACLDVMDVMNVRGMGVTLHATNLPSHEPVLYGQVSLPPGKIHRLADQLMVHLCQKKNPLLINDLSQDKNFDWLGEYAKSLLAVPLQRQDQVLGCLFGLDKGSGDFDSVDSKLLNSIANESAIYLENTMLFEDVHGLMMGLLHALTSAVDAKDNYTCGHSERVALLSRHLAFQIGLTDHQVERVYMAGLLHDVGKIGVPEAVLRKTGKLTNEEFDEIKKHPEIGARILQDIKQISDIIPGVLHHHERFDGKGYPYGLAGENIPLMGRIICLADCFDAMTSNRTYRSALPIEIALAEISKCAGTQFDPRLAATFIATGADQFKSLLLNHREQTKRLVELQQSLRVA